MKQALGILVLLFLVSCTVAERGDTLQLTYTGSYTNGTVFDTNDPALIGQVSKPVSQFVPLTVTLGRRQVIAGFEEALYGMKEGETKEVRIKAKDAYGPYDAQLRVAVPKRFSVPATMNVQRTVVVPREEIAATEIGEVFASTNFYYNITALNTSHVSLYMLNASENATFEGMGWSSTLIESMQDRFIYRHNIRENMTYSMPTGPYVAHRNGTQYIFGTIFELGKEYQGMSGTGRAVSETPDTIYVDFNHRLAGHDLVFAITLEEIARP